MRHYTRTDEAGTEFPPDPKPNAGVRVIDLGDTRSHPVPGGILEGVSVVLLAMQPQVPNRQADQQREEYPRQRSLGRRVGR